MAFRRARLVHVARLLASLIRIIQAARQSKTRCAETETLPSVSLGSDAGDFDACIGELVRFRVRNLVCAWNDVRFIEWSAGSLKGTYVPST